MGILWDCQWCHDIFDRQKDCASHEAKCASKPAELSTTAPNTGSPKFPTLEDVRKGIVAAGVCSEIGLDMNNFGVGVAAAHSIICRKLRAGA